MKVLIKGKVLPIPISYLKASKKFGINIYETNENFSAIVTKSLFHGPVIITGKKFESYTKYEKLFVILHEIGHIKNNHFKFSKPKRNIKLECEADSYACIYLHKKYTLKHNQLLSLFLNMKIKCKREELNKRLKNIEALHLIENVYTA